MDKHQQWLKWVSEIQAVAQAGLTYCKDQYCHERYEALLRLAAIIGDRFSDSEMEVILDVFKQEKGYMTPKLDVRGAIFKNDQILLVRERDDGRWTLPGGWVDVNESPSEAVVREVFEESGYHTKALKLLALSDKHKHDYPPQWPHAYKSFFLCELLGGQPRTNLEISAIGFFAEDQIPALSYDRISPLQIKRLFLHYRHPEWMTDFD